MNNNTNNNMGVNPQQYGQYNTNQQPINNGPIPRPNPNQSIQPMPSNTPRPQPQRNNQPPTQQLHQNISQQSPIPSNMNIQPVQQQTINPQPMSTRMPNNQPISEQIMSNQTNYQNMQQANIQSSQTLQTQAQPQTASPVQPVQQITPQDIVINNSNGINTTSPVTPSVIEEATQNNTVETNDKSDVADITFDYNSIYGIPQDKNEVRTSEEIEKPIFTAQEIVIENRDLEGRTADDVVPEFNINALDANTNESDAKLTDNVLNDRQQDKADTRRKILFIAVLVAILIISVGFIFPIISGNKF